MTRERFSARTRTAFAATGLPVAFGVRAATADTPAEILLYDEIGGWGISDKDFRAAMATAGAGPLVVRINSPGGDVFDGLAIYNALLAHPGGVTCVVDGLAASAASYIAQAGSAVHMAESSMMMIHNAWTLAIGNKADMAKAAAELGRVDSLLTGIYAKRAGMADADVAAAMDAETWYTATEAKTAGLCDAVMPAPAKKDAAAGLRGGKAHALRAALRAAYDPDGDGDDDIAEAIAAILAAQDSLGDAVAALTGAPDADDSADAEPAMAAGAVIASEDFMRRVALRARIALAR